MVPNISDELIRREPWLQEHKEHSVTEMEVLHGVLNDPAMAGNAFFYFRDPAYIDQLPPMKSTISLKTQSVKRSCET